MRRLFRQAPVTLLLAAANIVVFLVLSFLGQTEDGSFMLAHGAMYVPLVVQNGEYYRMFTSMFLHFGFEHLANNMVSLLIFGMNLEAEIGPVKYLVIYFISGLGGNFLSAWADVAGGSYAVSAGASGAIFGLIGACLYVALRNRGRIGNISGRGVIFVIIFTFYYGLTSSGVDNMAHLGGLIGGFILGLLLYRPHKSRYNDYRYDD